MKVCNFCNKTKTLDNFYKDGRTEGHYRPKCKSCFQEDRKNNSIKNKNYQKKYRKENPDKVKESRKKSYIKHYEKILIRNRSSKARRRAALGSYYETDVQNLLIAQRKRCASCRCNFKKTGYHVDHIMPIAKGGTNFPDNLQLLCPTCNKTKGPKDPYKWAQENGRLL